jgi:hypothetical protein
MTNERLQGHYANLLHGHLLSLFWIGTSNHLKLGLRIAIAAIQEIKHKGEGIMNTGNFTTYFIAEVWIIIRLA